MYDKIVDSNLLDFNLKEIANAIRTKTTDQKNLDFPQGFVTSIKGISAGGGNTEIVKFFDDTIPKFSNNEGTVNVWGWGQGQSLTGHSWDAPNYLFLGDKYSEYIGGETIRLNLSISINGELNGLPDLITGEAIAIKTV